MSDYLTFEQASEFLNTSRSTLYRWLREGRIPGHKMGRQWRFLRSELEAVRRGDVPAPDLAGLSELLRARAHHEDTMNTLPAPELIAEELIWDAVDHGASVIHIGPSGDHHAVRYRTESGLEALVDLPASSFEALDREWTKVSKPVRGENRRRIFLERDHDSGSDRLQVRYQKVETFAGERVTLRLVRENRFPLDVETIAPRTEDTETLRSWLGATHGLILVAGRSGSGKTTTTYICLNELSQAGDKVIFTIEDEIGMYLSGVNQVEIDLDDERAYREAFSAIFDSDVDVLFISSTFAQRHRATMWNTAVSAAESGHLVFVQLEADSAEDAIERMRADTDRPFDDVLVGAVWQELVPKEGGGREANYTFVSGPLAP